MASEVLVCDCLIMSSWPVEAHFLMEEADGRRGCSFHSIVKSECIVGSECIDGSIHDMNIVCQGCQSLRVLGMARPSPSQAQ